MDVTELKTAIGPAHDLFGDSMSTRVQMLSYLGLPAEDIALFVGMSEEQLHKQHGADLAKGWMRTAFAILEKQIELAYQGDKAMRWVLGLDGGDQAEYERVKNSRVGDKVLLVWRNAVLLRDKNKCVRCGSKKKLRAHHKKHWVAHPELRYEIDNGETLCALCHAMEHPEITEMIVGTPGTNVAEMSHAALVAEVLSLREYVGTLTRANRVLTDALRPHVRLNMQKESRHRSFGD